MSNNFIRLLTPSALLLLLLLSGCSKSNSDSHPEGPGWIGPEGGRYESAGIRLEIPEGALSEWVEITSSPIADPTQEGMIPTGAFVCFSPAGRRLSAYAHLTLSYDAEKMKGRTIGDLKMWQADQAGGTWVRLVTFVDEYNVKIASDIESLTCYGPGVPGGAVADGDMEIEEETGETPEGEPDLVMDHALDFGRVALGTTLQRTLRIENRGAGALHIRQSIPIEGSDPAFTLTEQGALVIEPGNGIDFPVRFAPLEARAYSGSFTLSSDDPATPETTVALTGWGSGGGRIEVTPGRLDFGPVEAGESKDLTFVVTNLELEKPLGILSMGLTPETPPVFEFSPADAVFPLRIDGGQSRNFVVTYRPTGPEHREGALDIQSDDADNYSVTLLLTGGEEETSDGDGEFDAEEIETDQADMEETEGVETEGDGDAESGTEGESHESDTEG